MGSRGLCYLQPYCSNMWLEINFKLDLWRDVPEYKGFKLNKTKIYGV